MSSMTTAAPSAPDNSDGMAQEQQSWPARHADHTPDWHRQMIQEAAYFRAEARGFVGGDPVEDWLAAEAEIDAWVSAAR
jgi:DUF2934 family protein